MALCELLSHFWKCFPATTPQQEQKVVKMHEALHRYHAVKLKPFEVIISFFNSLFAFLIILLFQDKLIRELSPLSHHLTKHINQLLNAAYQKFNTWQKLKTHHR